MPGAQCRQVHTWGTALCTAVELSVTRGPPGVELGVTRGTPGVMLGVTRGLLLAASSAACLAMNSLQLRQARQAGAPSNE